MVYDSWKTIFNKHSNDLCEDSIVICHSIGNEFLIKYLKENKLKIDLYIGLAGFSKYFEWEDRQDLHRACKDFLVSENEINYFKDICNTKYAIYSDNDHIVPFDVLAEYPKSIKAKPILIKRIGYMGKKSGLEHISEVVEIIKSEEK